MSHIARSFWMFWGSPGSEPRTFTHVLFIPPISWMSGRNLAGLTTLSSLFHFYLPGALSNSFSFSPFLFHMLRVPLLPGVLLSDKREIIHSVLCTLVWRTQWHLAIDTRWGVFSLSVKEKTWPSLHGCRNQYSHELQRAALWATRFSVTVSLSTAQGMQKASWTLLPWERWGSCGIRLATYSRSFTGLFKMRRLS